jgi:integrase
MATVIIQRRKGSSKLSYQVYYKEPGTGRRKYYKTYSRLKEAQIAANDLRAILDSGKPIDKKPRKLRLMTLSEVGESLRAEWDRVQQRGEISSKTYSDYGYWLDVLIREFGNRLLCRITETEIEDYLNAQTALKSKVSSNKYLAILKKLFQHGLALNTVIVDPAARLKKLSEKDHERKRFLLPRELDRLIKATEKTRAKFYLPAIIYLGAEHGASKQEILDLKWPDIDFAFFDTGIIRLFRTKNKRERVEYLMPRTKLALLDWQAHLTTKRKKLGIREAVSDNVFTRIDGSPIKNFNKAWWSSPKIAGITNFRFHDLRHTFASNLLLSGASLKDVKEMIGHKDISMTDRYSHLTLDHKLLKQKGLAEHYANRIEGVGNK